MTGRGLGKDEGEQLKEQLAIGEILSPEQLAWFLIDMEYEGGGTYFSEDKLIIKEDKRNIVIHPGRMTHRHGVRPIIKGERYDNQK